MELVSNSSLTPQESKNLAIFRSCSEENWPKFFKMFLPRFISVFKSKAVHVGACPHE